MSEPVADSVRTERAAGAMAWGVVLVVVALFALLTSGYLGVTYEPTWRDETSPSVVFAWVAWVSLAAGVVCLGVGVYRIVQRSDQAGVR